MNRPVSAPLLEVSGLEVRFSLAARGVLASRPIVRAVDDVSFDLAQGETLGVVGESGCGKSTLARAIIGLVPANSGRIVLGGLVVNRERRQRRQLGRVVQMVFQDPLASLNPRMTVAQIVAEPLLVHDPDLSRKAVRARVSEMLEKTGLSADYLGRYPQEFSGGQCQRIALARALILGPRLLICDEAVSALDVSVQAQILNLLADIRAQMGLSMLFIGHDLSVIRLLSDRVMVMHLGKISELGEAESLFGRPRHPYTRALIESVPQPDPGLPLRGTVTGEIPSPLEPPAGCSFHPRCPVATERCRRETPALSGIDGREVACHYPLG